MDREGMTLRLDVGRDDELAGFGAFLLPREPYEGRELHLRLNVLGLFAGVGEDGKEIRFAPEEVKRAFISTMMHEFGHCLEHVLGLPVNERAIEEAVCAWEGVEMDLEAQDVLGDMNDEITKLRESVSCLQATANEYLRDYESALAREKQAQEMVAELEGRKP